MAAKGGRRKFSSELLGLQRIVAIDTELNKIQDADLLLERILTEARKMVSAEAGTIYVRDGEKLLFRYTQNAVLEKNLPPGRKLPYSNFSVPVGEGTISGYVAMTGEILNINDVYDLPADAPYSYSSYYDRTSGYHTVSMLTVPLKTSAGGLLGVIQVINAKDDEGHTVPFPPSAETFITHFAANATVALQRAYMTRRMILGMNRLAELRDTHETGAHVNRVASIAAELYERWAFRRGLPEHERERVKDTLKLAAMLHDVGKVAISDLILKKPARFTDAEYMIMQSHTFCGARLFSDAESEFDAMAAEIALTHHENWDGTGYPGKVDLSRVYYEVHRIEVEGVERTGEIWYGPPLEAGADGRPRRLKGEEIPLSGRIVAIADVFDALSSKRVYKERWDCDAVWAEIEKLSGTKFDPELVERFLEIRPEIERIRERFPDAPEADAPD
ncbi:MAG: HD domain-containing protein [Spirochaetales bacterium]|nr:HD domain-containing protein [Spirochaetales bacterium]